MSTSPLIIACFALSGATSLVLQVVWVRKLIEVFGSSSLAISTVLATFMAGLALGAWLGGRLADRLARAGPARGWTDPLLYYGLAEAVVAVAAVLILAVADEFRGPNAWLWGHLSDRPALLSLARFAIAALVLGVPTTAMGATLPLLSRRVTQSRSDFSKLGANVGLLYAANTAGAVVGAGCAGFWFVPWLGVSGTNQLAAAVALGLATAVALVALAPRRSRLAVDAGTSGDIAADVFTDADEPDGSAAPSPPSAVAPRVALIAYALSGAVAMSLEVLLSRALAVVIGSSIHSFTLVLVVFLVGIATGSAVFAPIAARTRDPLRLLGWVFAAIAFAVLVTQRLVDDLPEAFLILLEGTRLEVGTVLWVHTILTGLVILPLAVGLGAVMPLAMRAYVGGLSRVGRDVGRAYAANTVGAILGAFAAGFFVLPVIGLDGGMRAAVMVDAAVALYLVWRTAATSRRAVAWRLLGSGALVGAIAAAAAAPNWNRSNFTAGLFRTNLAKSFIERGGLYERNVAYYRDGVATTVSVEKIALGHWVLKNNGKVEASNRHDMPTQILVGLLPVLLHDGDAQQVFVVGYGSGVTVGAIAQSPRVAGLDVAELEPAVLEAADRYFGGFNHRPERDPRVRRFIGDGRNVLLASSQRYDVIVSEPSNPWIAGVASLFTRDFYEFAKDHLTEDGVFCQWAQLYELGPRNVKMIYRTFFESFPYVYAFNPSDESTDTILIGSLSPRSFDVRELRERMEAPRVRAEMTRAQVVDAEQLAASLFLAPEDLPAFTAGADVNTDNLPRLEYLAPRDLLASSRGNRFAQRVRGPHWPYGAISPAFSGFGRGPSGARSRVRVAVGLLGFGRRRGARAWLEDAAVFADLSEVADARLLLQLTEPADFIDPELAITEGGPPLGAPDASWFAGPAREREAAVESLREGFPFLSEGNWTAAWHAVRGLPDRADSPHGRDVSLLMGYLAYKSVDLDRALALLEPLAEHADFAARRPAALYYHARVLYGRGRFRDGVRVLATLCAQHPVVCRAAAAGRVPAR